MTDSPTPESLGRELEERRQQAAEAGGADRIAAQHKKGKLTAGERIAAFLDPGSFNELEPYRTHRHTAFGLDEQRAPGDSVVTGFGRVDGRMLAVYAQDFTVLGGSFSEVQGQKVARLLDLALDSGVPIVGLMDSVGARIQEGVYSLAAFSELFWRNTQASGVVPPISVMLGPCAGGSVYSPGLTDFVIMTEGSSHMFITGPKVIETVTGEKVGLDELGGAGVHNTISGVAHFAAPDEHAALALTRRLLSYLPANNAEPAPRTPPADDPHRMDARLDSLVPTDPGEPYDVRAAITLIFDTDTFLEVHAQFAQNAVIGFARLHGAVVGVVANQPMALAGVLDIDSSDKIARFIRFCDAFNVPLITLVDTPGFLPGVREEHGGIIRHGAKIVYAYSEATVPKLAVILRKAYGGAYIVMSSKHIRTDVVYAWPTAEIAVMGAEGAVQILYADKLKDRPDREQAERESVEAFRREFGSPYAAAESGHIDDVLHPSETRPKLIAALELLRDKRVPIRPRKHGNIPL